MGSPLGPNSTKESLKELGMKMKKNGIAIDIIDYGTENRSNTEILAGLIESIDTEAYPSHLITVESNYGVFLLDALKSNAPELFNRSGSAASGGMDGGDGFDFDPEMDPELAMALKLSMEEEMNRQKATVVAAAPSNDNENEEMETFEDANEGEGEIDGEEDEELMMARAIALSMEQAQEDQHNQ